MTVTTYGWESSHPTYIYLLGILTVIWAVTVAASVYSLKQYDPSTEPLCDPSDPVHLMMASSAGGLRNLAGFEDDGEQRNESVRVHLERVSLIDDKTKPIPQRSGMQFVIDP